VNRKPKQDFYMKKILISLTALSAALLIFSCSKEAPETPLAKSPNLTGETHWYSFNEGFKKALKEKKPMVIDFYADWCKWCKVMEKETFADSDVAGKLNKDYIAIRIHTDKPGNERIQFKKHNISVQEFSSMMGVQGLPTLVFMDATGQPITKIPGFIKKDVFLPLLSYMTEKCYAKNIAFEAYLKGNSPCSK